ncbi:IS66 family insertion sequence element accessory protein TnpA [Paenibacillus plantiphilus]
MEIIRNCRGSGQTVKAWCTEHHVSSKSYYYWLKRVREAACEALPTLHSDQRTIVPVDLSMPRTSNEPIYPASTESDIIVHMGSVTLEIRNHASLTLIEHTLRALQHAR